MFSVKEQTLNDWRQEKAELEQFEVTVLAEVDLDSAGDYMLV